MDNFETRWHRDAEGIHIDVEIQPEITVPLEFNLSDTEYARQIDILVNWRTTRIQRAAKLYFADKRTVREIAEVLKISKSQVHNDIAGYRNEVLKSIKQEVGPNGSAFGLIVELLTQVENRIRLLSDNYDDLQNSLKILGIPLERIANRLKANPKARITNANVLKEIVRERRILMEAQKNILAQLRAETQQLLNIYEAFGLANREVLGLVNIGENDLQQRIEEVKALIPTLIKIIKLDVTDETQRQNIFGRLANFIRENALSKHLTKSEVENDFRI
ncbi:MAG: sporulation transcriptional regulator SpoIIID [Candidatus Omnitrophica bacterium]|jgi:DNA-binding Lrp family transcriptional regulator|nr:sporulation transcriptional regulator SpoIIID [Candidatus Omnitrophota bacterium]